MRMPVVVTGLLAMLAIAVAQPSAAAAGACRGSIFNPITDTNWNNMFPITVGGISAGGGSNPPLMHMPALCMCPGAYGIPVPGIGLTYWEPTYVAEVATVPGCLSTLGGVMALPGFERLATEKSYSDGNSSGGTVNRLQIHWYNYPVFSVLNMMSTLGCSSMSGISLATPTEIDPLWQDDLWAAIAFPETALFANPLGQLACVPDVIASAFERPLEMMPWCQGGQSTLYPPTGISRGMNSPQGTNLQVLAKFMQRSTRMGQLLTTIGPSATCSSSWLPNMIRSQYRLDPIAPVASNQRVTIGKPEMIWAYTPPINYGTRSDSAFLVWVGRQCCLRY